MLVDIIGVKYLHGYMLELEFENGVKKTVDFEEDLKKYSGSIIDPLKRYRVF